MKRGKNTGNASTNGQLQTTALQMLTESEQRHLETFARHRHIYDLFDRSGELVNFHHHIQAELLEAYRELVDPYYRYSNTCPVCVAEFITTIYRWYDKHTHNSTDRS